MVITVHKPYPKHKAGLAALPLHLAVFLPILFLVRIPWLSFLLGLPCWIGIDYGVFRFLVWQVNSLRRPIWQPLLVVVLAGLTADLILVGVFYLISAH